MNATDLVDTLFRRRVELTLEGDRLRCHGPDSVLTPQLLASLRARRDELIRHLAEQGRIERVGTLSARQLGVWTSQQILPESTAHHILCGGRLRQDVDLGDLTRALQTLLARHPVLRTTVAQGCEGPASRVRSPRPVEIERREVRGWTPAQVDAWFDAEAGRSFDLEHGPLLRVQLLIDTTPPTSKVDPERTLLLSVHELVADPRALDLLLDDLARLYEAERRELAAPVPPTADYESHVRAEAAWLAGPEAERCWSFWQSRLQGSLAAADLPTDRPRFSTRSGRSASFVATVPASAAAASRQLAKGEHVPLSAVAATAFSLLLGRYTRQEEFLLGVLEPNRSDPEFADVIGPFAQPLALRVDFSGRPCFRDALHRIADDWRRLASNGRYPLQLITSRLNPPRDPSRPPIFQAALEFQDSAGDGDLFSEVLRPASRHGASVELALCIHDSGSVLNGRWIYDPEIFDVATVERMARHFHNLLGDSLARPNVGVEDLSLLSDDELDRIVVKWNDTARPFPRDRGVHQLIEARSAANPLRTAIVFRDEELSYGELDRRSNQVAHRLRSLGVGPDTLVGLCIERSCELIIGLLGVLKAGGAYLPLDPSYPEDRLQHMLDDSCVRLVLTQRKLDGLLDRPQLQRIHLDDQSNAPAPSAALPSAPFDPESLIYVIYTSGSTGMPKGVAVRHISVSNVIEQTNHVCEVDEASRVLQFAPISFDASVWEILRPLVAGGTLVVAADDERLPGGVMEALLKRQRVTHAAFPPFYLAMADPEGLPDLTHLAVSFEACPQEVYRKWSPGRAFFNAYGPTEATVCATGMNCEDEQGALPIGKPGGNIQVYVVDEALRPVPLGVPGELAIGGVGLARGYLNRPDATSARFVPNPFGREPGARLYRTGDLGRYRSDGNLEFLGRIDSQVKVRGFRIEPGEIEAVLGEHPRVREAVIVAREDEPGHKKLVAYVVPNSLAEFDAAELRTWVKTRLPTFAVPALFAILEELPLSPNGKVDRQRLPAPRRPSLIKTRTASPRTQTEAWVAGAWKELLGLDDPGIHDDFFEFGGDSLLAVQFANQIRDELDIELPLAAILASPTVASLGARIDELQVP